MLLYVFSFFNILYCNFQKKAKDHFGIEGDEGSTMVEDNVAPAK